MRKLSWGMGLAGAVLASGVALAAVTGTGGFTGSGALVPGGGEAAGRSLLNLAMPYLVATEYGARADTKIRGAHLRITSGDPNVAITTTYVLRVQIACTSGSNQIIMTPGIFPDRDRVNSFWQANFPQCGSAGADYLASITSIGAPGATQTLTVAGSASNTITHTVTLVVGVIGNYNASMSSTRRNTYTVGAYRADWNFVRGNKTITVPSGLFHTNFDRTQTGLNAVVKTDIAIPNGAGASCDRYHVTKLLSNTTTTGELEDAPECSGTNVAGIVYWGTVLDPDDVTKYFQVANIGTTQTDWVSQISAVHSPVHWTASTNAPATNVARQTFELTWGTDDTAAIVALGVAAETQGIRIGYIPEDTAVFMPTAASEAAVARSIYAVNWCGGGKLILPSSFRATTPVAFSCTNTDPNDQIVGTIDPDIHLRTASAATTTYTYVLFADSQGSDVYQETSADSNLPGILCGTVRKWNPDKLVNCVNRAIGGLNWSNLDPDGPNGGAGAGIPTGTLPSWYVGGTKWIAHGHNVVCPDTVFIKLGTNDRYNFLPKTVDNVIAYTQGATWGAACNNKYPDVILITDGVTGRFTTEGLFLPQAGTDYVMAYLRGYARMCPTRLNNGGCPGLIDLGQAKDMQTLGVSVDTMSPAVATAVVPRLTSNDGLVFTAATYSWPSKVQGYAVTTNAVRVTPAANASDWWTTTGYIDYATGAGAYGTPHQGYGQTGAAVAPSGGKIRLENDGGFYKITNYLYDVAVTATMTVNTATVTCSAACVNQLYIGSTIEIPGAGAAGGLYTGTVTAIPENGTTITVSPSVATNLGSASTTIRLYKIDYSTTTTEAISCDVVTTSCDAGFIFSLNGTEAAITDISTQANRVIWRGHITRFGGLFTPAFSFGAAPARWLITASAKGLPRAAEYTVNNGIPTLPPYTDSLMWGRPDGLVSSLWGGANRVHATGLEAPVLRKTFGMQMLRARTVTGGTQTATPTAGSTVTVTPATTQIILNPAGTLATLTLALSPVVPAGSSVRVFTTQTITALTVSVPSGYTISGAPTTLSANTGATFMLSGTTFYRVQ